MGDISEHPKGVLSKVHWDVLRVKGELFAHIRSLGVSGNSLGANSKTVSKRMLGACGIVLGHKGVRGGSRARRSLGLWKCIGCERIPRLQKVSWSPRTVPRARGNVWGSWRWPRRFLEASEPYRGVWGMWKSVGCTEAIEVSGKRQSRTPRDL